MVSVRRRLGPKYLVCQIPWTYYYKWIKGANDVISLSGETPEGAHKYGAGQAYATRAWMYLELSQMFAKSLMPSTTEYHGAYCHR